MIAAHVATAFRDILSFIGKVLGGDKQITIARATGRLQFRSRRSEATMRFLECQASDPDLPA
jgi:hypothetical protein